jgi:dephospho-CoA kinase
MPPKTKSRRMKIIGLTGSIGMGKSTAALILREMGFPIYSADAAVHNVLKKSGRAVAPVARLFPETLRRGAIDRKLLGQAVFGQPKKLRQLERIIHPLLRDQERAFLQKARATSARAAILEIPLLFETSAEKRCDITLCVTASRAIQKKRVLSRPGMSEEKLRAILARQMPNAEKCRKADYAVPTGQGLLATEKYLRRLLIKLSLLP